MTSTHNTDSEVDEESKDSDQESEKLDQFPAHLKEEKKLWFEDEEPFEKP